jgi:hypothetical protein
MRHRHATIIVGRGIHLKLGDARGGGLEREKERDLVTGLLQRGGEPAGRFQRGRGDDEPHAARS